MYIAHTYLSTDVYQLSDRVTTAPDASWAELSRVGRCDHVLIEDRSFASL